MKLAGAKLDQTRHRLGNRLTYRKVKFKTEAQLPKIKVLIALWTENGIIWLLKVQHPLGGHMKSSLDYKGD